MLGKVRTAIVNRTGVVLGTLTVIAVIIVVYGALSWQHVDTQGYVALTAPIITVLLGLLAIGNQVSGVRDTIEKVEKQTNGKLNAKFNALHQRLDKAGIPKADIHMEVAGEVGEPQSTGEQNG